MRPSESINLLAKNVITEILRQEHIIGSANLLPCAILVNKEYAWDFFLALDMYSVSQLPAGSIPDYFNGIKITDNLLKIIVVRDPNIKMEVVGRVKREGEI